MKARWRRFRATVWLLGTCLKERAIRELDVAADILEAESGKHFHLVMALGFIWEFSGVACALAKMPEIYGPGGMIGVVLIRLIAVIMIPLGAVILIPAGRVCARRWRTKRKQNP